MSWQNQLSLSEEIGSAYNFIDPKVPCSIDFRVQQGEVNTFGPPQVDLTVITGPGCIEIECESKLAYSIDLFTKRAISLEEIVVFTEVKEWGECEFFFNVYNICMISRKRVSFVIDQDSFKINLRCVRNLTQTCQTSIQEDKVR